MKNSNLLILILVVVLVIAIIVGLFFTIPKVANNREQEDKLANMQADLARKQEELNNLLDTSERLKRRDPDAIEKVARDKYGFSKEGEEVYQTAPMK